MAAVREPNVPRRPYSTQTRVSSPDVATSARIRARPSEIANTPGRPTTGTPAVRNAASAPLVVPAELRATSLTWYSAPGESPATDSDTATAPRPEPALLTTVVVPYAVVGPSSNHHVVERPTGSTLPVSTTVTPETCAPPVTARGPALVENERVCPTVVPASLRAPAR